jgi:hypothetical protein
VMREKSPPMSMYHWSLWMRSGYVLEVVYHELLSQYESMSTMAGVEFGCV